METGHPVPPASIFRQPSDFYDPETLQDLEPRRLPRTQSFHERIIRSAADKLEKTPSLQRAGSDLKDAVKGALQQTSSLGREVSRTSSLSAREGLAALQCVASGDIREASAQVESAWKRFERGALAHLIARTLVCIFFMDCCLEKYKNWEFYQQDFWQKRIQMYPHRYKDPGFPYFALFIVVPCTLLTILGVRTRLSASVLLLDMLRHSAGIIFLGMKRVVQHKLEPDELTTKHLAMLGSAVLILAHSVRDRYATSNTVAGLIIGNPDKPPSHVKSLVLLFSRLALTLLFVTVGVAQVKRVIQRDWKMVAERTYLRSDGHDNNFLLIEAALAVPFAIGYRTRLIALLLAVTLIGEAVFCWWPLESWPSVQYQSHVRNHFATNLGAAGGLLLLKSCGPGRYTVDGFLQAKKDK